MARSLATRFHPLPRFGSDPPRGILRHFDLDRVPATRHPASGYALPLVHRRPPPGRVCLRPEYRVRNGFLGAVDYTPTWLVFGFATFLFRSDLAQSERMGDWRRKFGSIGLDSCLG